MPQTFYGLDITLTVTPTHIIYAPHDGEVYSVCRKTFLRARTSRSHAPLVWIQAPESYEIVLDERRYFIKSEVFEDFLDAIDPDEFVLGDLTFRSDGHVKHPDHTLQELNPVYRRLLVECIRSGEPFGIGREVVHTYLSRVGGTCSLRVCGLPPHRTSMGDLEDLADFLDLQG